MNGGPFDHKYRTDEHGIERCSVCGCMPGIFVVGPVPGCPWGVNMATLKDIKRPAVPGQVEAAAAAIRAIWAAEKAKTEEAN